MSRKDCIQAKDAALLNYGFLDGGFYTTTGIIPNCRFFCDLNIELDEIMETQNELEDQAPSAYYKADGKIREIERDVAKRWKKGNIRVVFKICVSALFHKQ